MTDLYLIFQFVKGRCHGNQIMLPNEGKLILCTFFARSPDGRMGFVSLLLARGRHCGAERARLCHAFLVIITFAIILIVLKTVNFYGYRYYENYNYPCHAYK